MKILFINISDDSFGLGNTSVNALRIKYPPSQGHIVRLVELGNEALKFNDTQYLSSTANEYIDSALLGDNINDYDRIYIGVHGLINDINFCYIQGFKDEMIRKLFNYEKLANFVMQCLLRVGLDGDVGKQLNFVLAMCYGARTAEYERNHVEEPVDFKQSFAYGFIQAFDNLTAQQHKLIVTAYTGAVGFDGCTGELTVETEEQIKTHDRQKELLAAKDEIYIEITELENRYVVEEEMNDLDRARYQELNRLFRSMRIELNKFAEQLRKPEYGKIVYKKVGQVIEIDDSGKYGLTDKREGSSNEPRSSFNENDVNSFMTEGCVIFSVAKK